MIIILLTNLQLAGLSGKSAPLSIAWGDLTGGWKEPLPGWLAEIAGKLVMAARWELTWV